MVALSKKIIFAIFNNSGFQSIVLYPNLMMVYTKRSYHALTQGIRTIKTFIDYKESAAVNIFTTKYKILHSDIRNEVCFTYIEKKKM